MKENGVLFLLFFFAFLSSVFAQSTLMPAKDAYLRELRPGKIPVLFAPDRISDGLSNRDMAISPAGDEMYYTVQSPNGKVSVIIWCRWRKGVWSKPEVAPFSGKYSDLEPSLSSGGDSLFFASNRPLPEIPGRLGKAEKIKDYDIWRVIKEKGKWGSPIRLDTVINTDKDEFYPSVALSGNLYFTRAITPGKGSEDIVVSEWRGGRYQEAYSLPGGVNSKYPEFNAVVDPQEHYLLFSSYGRPDDLGGGDLYFSYRKDSGDWMPAIHLDSTINSTALDFSPFVSPDKKYLFFTSERTPLQSPLPEPMTFLRLKILLQGPRNGLNDIYWIAWPGLLKKYIHDR